ncbi:MAG TPA: STAS domain-containing protein [Candidatus Baltobacteraceae bacterium]|jgi:anti-anti-sigma factor
MTEQPPLSIVTVELYGEFDLFRRDELAAALEPAAAADVAELHFVDTAYMDSTALGCMIRLRKQMLQRNPRSHVRIIAPTPQVRKLFEVAGLSEVFEIVESLDSQTMEKA